MSTPTDIDAIRERGILASMAGFPILLVMGIAWIAAGAASYVVPDTVAPWIYLVMGVPAMPVAIALEKRLGYVPAPQPNPLFPLAMQLLFVQIVAFPAILLVWDAAPKYVPVAFAAIVGAHFLPYQWIYRTRLYGVLAVVVAVGPFIVALFAGQAALHLTGFVVGPALLVGSLFARAHARATWKPSSQPNRGDRI